MEPLKRKRKFNRASFVASPVDLVLSPGGTMHDRQVEDEGIVFDNVRFR